MDELARLLSSIVANATPLMIASIGETITERVGVVNLSLDGTIQLSAMIGFVTAFQSDRSDPARLALGIGAAVLTGVVIALIVAVANIELRQDQVAVGFVLTLLGADLAQFLGQEFTRRPGPIFPTVPIPLLANVGFIGELVFKHNLLVYFSFILIFGTWFFMYRTRWGLALRAVGERPATAFARGTNVNLTRYFYTAVGGGLVGLAGASYSLAIKAGWANPPVMRGDGWIALAIVIFGGWHPFRVAFGAYLFVSLRALASTIQQQTEIPLVLVNTVPWILMIVTLLMVSSGFVERLVRVSPGPVQRILRNFLRSESPAALGSEFSRE